MAAYDPESYATFASAATVAAAPSSFTYAFSSLPWRTIWATSGGRLALPGAINHWSLTTLREKLIKIEVKVVTHTRYVTVQMAEVAGPGWLFQAILERIQQLRLPETVPGSRRHTSKWQEDAGRQGRSVYACLQRSTEGHFRQNHTLVEDRSSPGGTEDDLARA